MLTSSFCNFFFILLFVFVNPLIVKASSLHRWFIHVPYKMTWFEAQKYCREHHTDLATFRNVTEICGLQTPCRLLSQCWTGLHKDNNDVWSWSNGEELSFTHWYVFADWISEGCGTMGQERWSRKECSSKITFVCHEDLILMKEKKTWEEALKHCMSLDADASSSSTNLKPLYTLAHVNISGGNLEAREAALEAETEEVWVGLRFLAGGWLWMNGCKVNEDLPVCPLPGRYCGAMAKSGEVLPDMDCSERRSFLCSRRKNLT